TDPNLMRARMRTAITMTLMHKKRAIDFHETQNMKRAFERVRLEAGDSVSCDVPVQAVHDTSDPGMLVYVRQKGGENHDLILMPSSVVGTWKLREMSDVRMLQHWRANWGRVVAKRLSAKY